MHRVLGLRRSVVTPHQDSPQAPRRDGRRSSRADGEVRWPSAVARISYLDLASVEDLEIRQFLEDAARLSTPRAETTSR